MAFEATTILVVDDHIDLRWIRCAHLREKGFNVFEAVDGIEAMALLASGVHPKIILSDLDMPRCNGFRLIVRLRQEPAWAMIPVVLVSTDPRLRDIAEAVCVAGHVDKCASQDEFERTIDRALARYPLS